jgi:hypothetical protein
LQSVIPGLGGSVNDGANYRPSQDGKDSDPSDRNARREIDAEFGHGRGYDPQSVFGTSSTVTYPYGKDLPSPTYHPDFPRGSNVGNDPVDPNEEEWVKELNKLIYEEKYNEFELGDIDETYTPVNVQTSNMDKFKSLMLVTPGVIGGVSKVVTWRSHVRMLQLTYP